MKVDSRTNIEKMCLIISTLKCKLCKSNLAHTDIESAINHLIHEHISELFYIELNRESKNKMKVEL